LERARLFVMIGTAEDHHSNPLKKEISAFKRRGGRFTILKIGFHAVIPQGALSEGGSAGLRVFAVTEDGRAR
jgi:hypothetical protein